MKTKKHNINIKNKTLKIPDFLKPKTLWQKRLKKIADRDLALIPKNIKYYKIIDNYTLLLIKNNQIKFYYNFRNKEIIPFISERITKMKEFLEKLIPLPDICIPFYFGDSYLWEYNGPYFCYSKPINKNGLLMPNWNFVNWDETKEIFKSKHVDWKNRKDEIYFKGISSSKGLSEIREKLSKIYSSIKLSGPFEEPSKMCEYKFVFDLPGRFPWSVRTPFIELCGAQPITILLYYPKWNEDIWVQFYNYKKPSGLQLKLNYHKEISDDNIEKIKLYVEKIKKKKSIHKSDLFELSEKDIAFYMRYLFTKLQNYNFYFKKLLNGKYK